jgi:hypothetical protein
VFINHPLLEGDCPARLVTQKGALGMWQNEQDGLLLPFVAVPVRDGRMAQQVVIGLTLSDPSAPAEPQAQPKPGTVVWRFRFFLMMAALVIGMYVFRS